MWYEGHSGMDIADVLRQGESLIGQSVTIEGRFCGDIKSDRCVLIVPKERNPGSPAQGIPVFRPGLVKLLINPPYAAYVLPAPCARYALGGLATIAGKIVSLSEPASKLMDIASLNSTVGLAD